MTTVEAALADALSRYDAGLLTPRGLVWTVLEYVCPEVLAVDEPPQPKPRSSRRRPAFWPLVKARMDELNINQETAAQLCGISSAHFSMWNTGQRGANPGPEMLEKLSRGLGIPLWKLRSALDEE